MRRFLRRLRGLVNRRRVLGVGGCDETIDAGDYRLCVRLVHAGTRSQGRSGRLYLDGIEVLGEVGESIDVATPEGLVRFTYLGEERPHLWSISGWTMEVVGPGTSAETDG